MKMESNKLQVSQQESDYKWEDEFRDIPEWLLLQVLLRLPVKSVFRCKSVSPKWLSVIEDPYFVRSYTSRIMNGPSPSFSLLYRYIRAPDFQEAINRLRLEAFTPQNLPFSLLYSSEEASFGTIFKVLAASNGLVLCESEKSIHYICDLVTGHWIPLPKSGQGCARAGLVTQVNDKNVVVSYKAVFIHDNGNHGFIFTILSSDTGRWRSLELFLPRRPVQLIRIDQYNRHGVLATASCFIFNGKMHWLNYYPDETVVYDPCTDDCHLMKLPEDIDTINVQEEGGSYSLCDACQGQLRYFELARPQGGMTTYNENFCKMWVLKDYDKAEWCLEHQVRRGDIWTDDDYLMCSLLDAEFMPLAFHPSNLDIVYLRCIQPPCIASYSIENKSLQVISRHICSRSLSWRSVIAFEIPIWPAVPSGLLLAKGSS